VVDTAAVAELTDRYDGCDGLLGCSPLLLMSLSNTPQKPLTLTVTNPSGGAKREKSEAGKRTAASSLPRTAPDHSFAPRQRTIFIGAYGLYYYRCCYISRESKTTRNVLWSRASVCLSVCVSARGRMPTLLHGPGCNLGEW